MEKEKVKELIEQYFGDGFDKLDICLKRIDIGITALADLNYEDDRLIIMMEEYGLVIPYKSIKNITI